MTTSVQARVLPLTVEQEKQFQAWRAEALEKMPYFARIVFSLRVLNAPGLGTWAVDAGYRMYVDFEAVAKKGLNWNVESVLHEASHLFAEHSKVREELGVKDKRGLKILNVSNDLSINDDLDESGCVTFRSDKMLPEFIGEPNNQTPHYYYGVLNSKVKQDITAPPKNRISVRPREIPVRHVKGRQIVVSASPAFIDPNNFEVIVVDTTTGAEVALIGTTASPSGIIFTIDEEIPAGTHIVAVASAGTKAETRLAVVSPSITLDPDHLENGWVAPQPITIHGKYVTFTENTTATLIELVEDPNNPGVPVERVVPCTTGPIVVSDTEIRFDIDEQIADGLYVVKVMEGQDEMIGNLMVGLPYMEINPKSLPVDYHGTPTVEATCADFTFNSSTTFSALLGGFIPVPAFDAVNVKTRSYAELTVTNGLPKGAYVVIAETAGECAYGVLSVSDDGDDGGGSGDPDEDEKDAQGGSDPGEGGGQYKGCGSGSGGEGWDGELDPADDMDGQAPSMSPAEQEAVKVATAAAIKEHAAKGRGTVPGGLVALADKILAPSKTPWQKVLASVVRRTVASKNAPYDVDRSRRHRRKHNMTILTESGVRRVVMPAYHQPIPSIHLIRDTSGSMSATDIAVVTRECQAIAKKMGIRGDQFKVTDVDADVYQTVNFTKAADIRQVTGRGGTDMRIGIEAIWGAKQRPSVIVVATDGDTPWPEVPGSVPVIACIIPPQGAAESYGKARAAHCPDWMKVIVVDPGEDI